ncbi:MAG: LysM peptidoglycan-binding domain-containing protein [Chloroflexi bacterium]|nr:LysM peptidoglycan-binding domain-containing protein [Chloroflexota bacterium]
MELWVNDTLIAARDAPADATPTGLVLSAGWSPRLAGSHLLIVRAFAKDGTEGQATVAVEAVESGESETATHVVQEGETLESIAESYGTTPEELAGLNPGLDPGGPAPGDELLLPGDEPPAGEGGAPAEEGGAPPVPEADPPGALESVFDLYGLDVPLLGVPFESLDFFAGEPTGLRLEFLSLSTGAAYEQLHCYVGVANVPPRWYPDEDGDQTSDESFALEGARPGEDVYWSVENLSGDSAPVFFWPRNRDLPVSVSCVGIRGGGTEAVELGRWENSISPSDWAGIIHGGGMVGADDAFEFAYLFWYRITRLGGGGGGVPLWLDHDMTPPTNARLDERSVSLRWDYNPRADEEAIDGFRVYLNGNLQWVEPADSRESMLPYEWFNPPCGTTYTFAVTAYRFGLPDGPESFPAIAILEQPARDCHREVQITFLTLETFDLGGDGRRPRHHGDLGPVYGSFFANEQRITFDTRSRGSGGGSLDMPNGLRHNTLYNLGEMSADSRWRFSGMPSMIVDVPEGGTFQFGFHIMDQDIGRCRNASDPGCDDLICEGLSGIYNEDSAGAEWRFDSHNEGTWTTEDGRCRVTYQWGPAAGSPVGPGVPGWEPLPWISLEDFVVDEATGGVQLNVRNTGTAAWPWRDLTIELQSREGVSLGIYTWPDYVLEAGRRDTLEHPNMRLSAPFDACVMIDPYDDVLEEYERSGAMFHHPICPQVPDLVVTNVRYNPTGGGQINVTVQNVGEALRNRSLAFQTLLPDGSSLYFDGWPNITLGPREARTFINLGDVGERVRAQMSGGYSVVVNPHGAILESDATNNTFSVPAANSLMIRVMSLFAPWDYRYSVEFTLTAYAVSGDARRQVANLHFTDMDWDSCNRSGGCAFHFAPSARSNSVYWFPIFGDEALEVRVRAAHRGLDLTIGDTFLPQDNWDANGWGSTRDCSDSWSTPGWHPWTINTHEGHRLGLTFQVCQQSP